MSSATPQEASSSSGGNDAAEVKIRFTTGQTFPIALPLEDLKKMKVGEFKQYVKTLVMKSKSQEHANLQEMLNSTRKYIRLVYQGKLLRDAYTLEFYNLKPGEFIHCTLSEHVSAEETSSSLAPPQTTSVSASSSSSAPASNTTAAQIQPADLQSANSELPRGFDRLRDSGFDTEEITYMRNQFYSTRSNLISQYQQGLLTREQLHQLEEQWMNEEVNATMLSYTHAQNQQVHPHSINMDAIELGNSGGNVDDEDEEESVSIASYSEGNNYHMFLGIILSFLFGLVMLLWIFVSTVPRKFKYGVFAGIAANASFAVIRWLIPTPAL